MVELLLKYGASIESTTEVSIFGMFQYGCFSLQFINVKTYEVNFNDYALLKKLVNSLSSQG